MRKSEIFEKALQAVAQETELPESIILSKSRSVEVVDARCILVYVLACKGLYNSDIARLTILSRQAVRKILFNFSDRRKQSGNLFEANLKQICNMLEIKALSEKV